MPRRLPPRGLNRLQVELGRTFFALPESEGFVVAGEAALAAHRLTDRPTRDLHLIRGEGGSVGPAYRALQAEASERGWVTQQSPDDEATLLLSGLGHRVVVVVADGPRPAHPVTLTVLGPTVAAQDLAGRLVVQLSAAANPDRLVDVHALTRRYPTDQLVRLAERVEPGFDRGVLARALAEAAELTDEALHAAAEQVQGLRRFAREWSADLIAG